MKSILNGHTDKFEYLISKYQNYVFAIILNITGESSDIPDIAQEVFLSVFRSLSSYRSGSFKSWLGKITVSRAIDWKRVQARAPNRENGIEIDNLAQDNMVSLENLIINRDSRKQVKKLCQELPDKYSSTIEKYYFDEKSYEQIAVEEGISVKTVESRLYRARTILKERWEGDMP